MTTTTLLPCINSFTGRSGIKILSPALRLSYMVLPRSLLATFHGHYQDYSLAVSLMEQRT
ncbi:hypothetical protein KI809_11920 [Geobacter pelophilus]|uniref:Uncharacterized protein n=1 Tax=Geoanaerobacter pelophilus TaxID=60036 RepID=A0AAW4L7I4_9BACT|nr:hypothetical protein [Geoanaerobacter pelophilus]MBT0665003.1 hypothetical protein [Geoanaerobacter pelophilus]